MRLLGFDLETTGLDWKKERILEIGISLHLANDPVYLHQTSWTLYDEEIEKRLPLTPEITRLTGLKSEAISEFGIHPTTALRELEQYCIDRKVDFIVGHNCTDFDRPFLLHELDKFGIQSPCLRGLPWIDTRKDIPYPQGHEPRQRSLEHLLMQKRFIPSISHRALSDAENTMWLLSHYPFEQVLEYWEKPWRVVCLDVGYEDRAIAKQNGYSWQECGNKYYSKKWVKLLKEDLISEEQKKFPEHQLKVLE